MIRMSNKTCFNFVLVITALFLAGTNINVFSRPNEKLDMETIMTIGEEKISFGEVRRVYDKNIVRGELPFEFLTKDSARIFLDIYSKYKKKVIAGIKAGYDTDSFIIADIDRNRKVLAEAFLVDNEVREPALQRYTEMRKKERRIAIIMTNFSHTGDTTDAYKNIMSALTEINRGETFEFAAKKYSADSITAVQGGLVPNWVTGLKLQRELENIIYGLKAGEISQSPIKTGHGYFLIKVLKEEPRTFISISNILIPYQNENFDVGPIVKDTADARRLADSISKALSGNTNKFGLFAEKFSSDKQTSSKGGHLGIYSRSTGFVGTADNIALPLEEAVFELKDKQITQPIETAYGIFILKRDSTVVFPDHFEYYEMLGNYNRLFLKIDKERYYDSVAKIYGLEMNLPAFENLLSLIDTTKTIFDATFFASVSSDLLSQTLFSIDGKSYSVKAYIDTITSSLTNKVMSANRKDLEDVIISIVQYIIVEKRTKDVNKQHINFDMLLDEFAAGMISFKAEEENVWNKVKFDTVRAKRFYDTTKMDLNVQLQYDISEIYVMSKKKANEVYDDIKSGKITFDSAVGLYSQRQGTREKKGHYGVVNTSNFLANQAVKNEYKVGDISNPLSFEQGFSIIRVNDILPERKMTFEEAIPLIASTVQSEFQNELQNNWTAELSKKYPVTFNNKLIDKVFKKK